MVKEYTSSNNNAYAGDLENDEKRNRLIQNKVGKGKQEDSDHCNILGIYTNTYKKWNIDSLSQKRNDYIYEGKYHMYTRMVMLNHCFVTYHDVSPLDFNWWIESVYVLCDAKKMMVYVGIWKEIYSFSWCVYNSNINTDYNQYNLVYPCFEPDFNAKSQRQILDLGTYILGVT